MSTENKIKHHVGCSGFHYSAWKNVFYPAGVAQKKWFEFYCQHFNTLELNVTFYRFPQLSFLQSWYKRSPAKFAFAVKVPRLITHYKQFSDTEKLLSDFYETIHEGLQEKLGPVLFQLGPRTIYREENLQKILLQLNNSFLNVIEFRHSSWWNTDVFDALQQKEAFFCSISYPGLPDEVISNNSVIYYRFHGVPKLYRSEYSPAFLKKILTEVEASKPVKQAYYYFNNTDGGAAIRNAKYLQDLTESDHY